MVGVIDTGIDYNHPDLRNNIWTNPGETGAWSPADPASTPCRDKSCNGIDDDGNGYIDDVHGYNFVSETNHDPMDDHFHGTHVAGTIGAVSNNAQGVAGINWNVSLVALKFLNENGSGAIADAVRAVEYATKMKIPITNNSWGGGGADPTLKAAIDEARKAGSVFVAAAGNSSGDTDVDPSYPASYKVDNVISVAAVDSQGNLANFSNYGATSVHLAAPGVDILSTVPLRVDPSGYKRLSGTSMAAPHVAGAIALIKALYPDAGPLKMKSRVVYAASKSLALEGKVLTSGILDIDAALVEDSVLPSPVTDLKVNMSGITSMKFQWSPSGDDGGSGKASFYIARISSQPLKTTEDWAAATPTPMVVTSSSDGSQVIGSIKGLALGLGGFITLRAVDNVGNVSDITSSSTFQLATPEVLYENSTSDLSTVSFDRPKVWGVETVDKIGRVFSDSPKKLYENNVNASLILPPVQVVYPDALLQFKTKLSCDAGFDWAYVEYQIGAEVDPTTKKPIWRKLAEYSAMGCDWANISLQFGDKVAMNDIVTLRFRFESNGSGREDGWLIQGIKTLGVATPKTPANFTLSVFNSNESILNWVRTSRDLTRSEIGIFGNEKQGEVTFSSLFETDRDTSYMENTIPLTDPKLSKLRIRACNGLLCSPSSPFVVRREMMKTSIFRYYNKV
ncbi:MAG: S8 family serine peptidase, partial [Deltaproteobacteria bacterium]